ncbi:MAG: hypothetical protein KDK08_16725 [Rhizobiaceae bacterium]|nr:hypothetical protein [Alphaproteobacteria bacterium]MCB1468740.1 hypothetical protein [Rhizobiaceae bacterium]
MVEIKKLRVLAAFLVAPAVVPIGLAAHDFYFNSGAFVGVYLYFGALFGYGFCFFMGVPAYFLLFRTRRPRRFVEYLYFAAACSVVFYLLLAALYVSQGDVAAMFTFQAFGASALFLFFSSISVSVFYVVAFWGGSEATSKR